MKQIVILVLITWCSHIHGAEKGGKVVCFYDSQTLNGLEITKVGPNELKPALSLCNYLVYGYVGINKRTFEVESLHPHIDLSPGFNNFLNVTHLKSFYPSTQFLLSVGGFRDPVDKDNKNKYLKLLEEQKHRGDFINSVVKLVKEYKFDGLDLGWEFPLRIEKKNRTKLGKIVHAISNLFNSKEDKKPKEHKDQFTTLVKELAAALRGESKILTLSILPHVNCEAYYDPPALEHLVDHVHLMTLDYKTPERDEEEADFSAPMQFVYGREAEDNVEASVKWWKDLKFPANKLFIAIPTYGVSWIMTKDSGKSGVPPVREADGPGEAGPYLQRYGRLSYYELCPLLAVPSVANGSVTLLQRVPDATRRQGTYAFRPATADRDGIWISFDDPEMAAYKAQYAKLNGLGGVAVVDITYDDFKGTCDNTRTLYPILNAVRMHV